MEEKIQKQSHLEKTPQKDLTIFDEKQPASPS